MKISIIIPVYNAEKYLHRCIDSILAQTFTDFELILIDDGSPDNCGKICEEYAKMDSRIHVIHTENKGVSTARNKGIEVSNGEFIYFADSDDWMSKDCLQKLYNACEKTNSQIAFSDYAMAYDDENNNKYFVCDIGDLTTFSNREALEYYAELNLKRNYGQFRTPWGKLIKKDLVLNNPFPMDRVYAEDAACVYLWMWNSKKLVHCSFIGYFYYQNNESICNKAHGKHLVGNFMTEEEWLAFFKRNGFPKLYSLTCERYINDCLWALNGIEHSKKQERNTFIKLLRKGLKKYGPVANVSLKTDSYIYEIAYPTEMKYYWYWQALKRKIKRN